MTTPRHQEFLGRLDGSAPAVFLVGLTHHNKGRDVFMPGMRRAPTAAEHELYRDIGDIFVTFPEGRRRVEVKWLTATFTGARDWPYRVVFVGTVSSVDRPAAEGELHSYVLVSKDYRTLAIIPAATRTSAPWRVVNRLARNTNTRHDYYALEKHQVEFVAVDDLLSAPFRRLVIYLKPKDANDAARIAAAVGGLLERGIE